MKSIAVFVFVVAVGVTLGYDFSDPLFNSVLMEDYLDLIQATNDNQGNVRARREVAVNDKNCNKEKEALPSLKCCKEAIELPEHYEKIKEVKKQCFADFRSLKEDENDLDFFSCDRLVKKKEDMRCAIECVAKKQNILDSNGNFKVADTKSYFKAEFVDLPWVQDNLNPIVDSCLSQADKEVQEEGKCNPKPLKFLYCMWCEYTKVCPVEKQKDTKTCKLIREGKINYFHHHPDTQ